MKSRSLWWFCGGGIHHPQGRAGSYQDEDELHVTAAKFLIFLHSKTKRFVCLHLSLNFAQTKIKEGTVSFLFLLTTWKFRLVCHEAVNMQASSECQTHFSSNGLIWKLFHHYSTMKQSNIYLILVWHKATSIRHLVRIYLNSVLISYKMSF